jgi:hypothetical protein
MTLTSMRSSASSSASWISRSIRPLSALRFSGRLSVIRATRSVTSNAMVSVDFSHLCALLIRLLLVGLDGQSAAMRRLGSFGGTGRGD